MGLGVLQSRETALQAKWTEKQKGYLGIQLNHLKPVYFTLILQASKGGSSQ